MYCMRCSKHVAHCDCPDIQERLSGLGGAGTNTAVQWCNKCNSHYARCKCESPQFVIRAFGQDMPLPKTEQ